MTSGRGHIITGTGSARLELNKLLFHKLLLVAGFWLLVISALQGQYVAGDYRSKANGNWTTLATWERFNGGTWVQPNAGQGYPGPSLVTQTQLLARQRKRLAWRPAKKKIKRSSLQTQRFH